MHNKPPTSVTVRDPGSELRLFIEGKEKPKEHILAHIYE